MLSIEQYRALLGQYAEGQSDEDVAAMREQFRTLGRVVLGMVREGRSASVGRVMPSTLRSAPVSAKGQIP